MQPAIAQQTSKKCLEGTFEKHTVSKKFVPEGDNTPHHIGVVPCAIVPDNLQAAVTKSRRYERTLNETFADFADDYGTTILWKELIIGRIRHWSKVLLRSYSDLQCTPTLFITAVFSLSFTAKRVSVY
jgi:hypothetical protein